MKILKIAVIGILFVVSSCQNKKKESIDLSDKNIKKEIQNSKKAPVNEDKNTNEIVKAKVWLVSGIEEYLNKQNDLAENTNEEAEGNTKSIFTKKYEEYKSDAINIDLDTDGSLTLQQFQKKWKNDFDCKLVGYDSGFLVGAQDWGLIKVTQCDYKTTEKGQLLFSVIISDTENKLNYPRDIKVIPSGKSLLISDVLEYE